MYVADGAAGLKIFSLLDPINPQLVSQIQTAGSAFEVIMENQYAYIALGAAGFDIIDISSRGSRDVSKPPGNTLFQAVVPDWAHKCISRMPPALA